MSPIPLARIGNPAWRRYALIPPERPFAVAASFGKIPIYIAGIVPFDEIAALYLKNSIKINA
jgi:hypothetical protein